MLKYLNSKQTIRYPIKAFKRQDGENDPKKMAEMVNKNFQETFVMEDYGPLPFFELITNEKIDLVLGGIKYENVLDLR